MKLFPPKPHAPVFVEFVRKFLPLLRQHEPLCVMRFEEVCDYLAWYWNRATISWITTPQGQPQAICLIKLFRHMRQFLDPVHEPCNRCVLIELMVAEEPVAMAKIFDDLVRRWGVQAVVMWDRGERTANGAPRIYRWDQFERLARRLTYGLIEKGK